MPYFARCASFVGWYEDVSRDSLQLLAVAADTVAMNGTYVYLLRSIRRPRERYVGLTRNIYRRLAQHNAGEVFPTAEYRPWKVVTMVWFGDRAKAEAFERYLKRGSGHAFARRHFW